MLGVLIFRTKLSNDLMIFYAFTFYLIISHEGHEGFVKYRFVVSSGVSQVSEMGIQVFHAGTALKEGGGVMTSGGRVLTVTAVRPTLESALRSANEGVAAISFPDAVYRRDIGHRAITYLGRSRCVSAN